MTEPTTGILQGDSRRLREILPSGVSVQCTLTSPPYFEVLTYGHKDEIGQGSGGYERYLEDLRSVFQQVYEVTETSGTCWVVVEGYKEDGKAHFLPGEVWRVMSEIGWVGMEVITWAKNKNRPWSNKGRFRSATEHILVFCKDPKKVQFDVDAVREPHSFDARWLAGWPERYSMAGKALTDLWEIDIPDQGTWTAKGNDALKTRHLCPFPVALVARVLDIATRPGDTVLDPFSGSGVVAQTAKGMGRKGIGIELVPEFVARADELAATFSAELRDYDQMRQLDLQEMNLERIELARLRVLKAAKVLAKESEAVGAEAVLAQLKGGLDELPLRAEFVLVAKKALKPSSLSALVQNEVFVKAQITPTFKLATRDWLDAQGYGQLWAVEGSQLVHFRDVQTHRRKTKTPVIVTPFYVRRYGWKESPFEHAMQETARKLVGKALDDAKGDFGRASRLLGLSLAEVARHAKELGIKEAETPAAKASNVALEVGPRRPKKAKAARDDLPKMLTALAGELPPPKKRRRG